MDMGISHQKLVLGTWVNRAASVSVYTDGHLFGARPRKMRLLGQPPSPEATVADLLEIHIPFQLRSQNTISGYSRGDPEGRTVHRQQYYERLNTGAVLRRCKLRLKGLRLPSSWQRAERRRGVYRTGAMQHPACGLPRTPILRGWANSHLIHDVESNDAQPQHRQDRAE